MKTSQLYFGWVATMALFLGVLISTAAKQDVPIARSNVEAGLCVLLFPHRITDAPKTSDLLLYLIQTTNQKPRTVWAPVDDAFRLRVELYATNGAAIPKTKLGRKLGSKFDKIPIDSSKVKLRRDQTVGNQELGRVLDLFEVPAKGEYKLKFELQLFVGNLSNKSRLVRFAPVEYRVVHE